MSDIKCVVCGEPWDAYGIKHGDMLPWQAVLFGKGAGCPSCEGVSNGWTLETYSDVENGDDDPMVRLCLAEDVANRPTWQRPADVVVWSCACCDTSVCIDADDGDEVATGHNAYRLNRNQDYEAVTVGRNNDTQVCACCVEYCDDCGTALCGQLSDDTYDGLASFPVDGDCYRSRVRCVDCEEQHDYVQDSWDAYACSDVLRAVRNALDAVDIDADDAVSDLDAMCDAARVDVDCYSDGYTGRDIQTIAARVVRHVARWVCRPCDPRAVKRHMRGVAVWDL